MNRMSIFSASLLAALLGLLSVNTFAEEGEWIKDQQGCKHFNPHPQPDEKLNWSGACKDGFADGKGQIKWDVAGKLAEEYDGEYLRGRPHGTGTMKSHENGQVYTGDWVAGVPTGDGKLVLPDGTTYVGQFLNWRFEGIGELTSPNGKSVYGEWVNGELVTRLERN
jgi:MORN repeat